MTTTTTTHTSKVHRWQASTVLGRRYRFRHRCSCGVRDPERADIQEAEYDQAEHQKEVAR
jgi:hypothetical protein